MWPNKNAWCEFHQIYGYPIRNCLSLGYQLDELVKSGFLKDYLLEPQEDQALAATGVDQGHEVPIHSEINTISGGFSGEGCTASQRKKYAREVMAVEVQEENHTSDVDVMLFELHDLKCVLTRCLPQFLHLSLHFLHLGHGKIGRDEEFPKAFGYMLLQVVFAQALHPFLLLEEGRQIRSMRRGVITSRGALPPPSCITMSRRDELLGGFSLQEGVRSSEAESVGAVTSALRFLLKTRPEQVSSSLEAVASTVPFSL